METIIGNLTAITPGLIIMWIIGGMLIFLVVSKKRRHVKRQTPDAVFLHHIFIIGLRSGRSAPSGPFFMSSGRKPVCFLRFFTTGKTRTEAPFSVLNL